MGGGRGWGNGGGTGGAVGGTRVDGDGDGGENGNGNGGENGNGNGADNGNGNGGENGNGNGTENGNGNGGGRQRQGLQITERRVRSGMLPPYTTEEVTQAVVRELAAAGIVPVGLGVIADIRSRQWVVEARLPERTVVHEFPFAEREGILTPAELAARFVRRVRT